MRAKNERIVDVRLDQVAAHHEIEVVFHLAALLSTRGERDPELAHQVNVEGTLHLLRPTRDFLEQRFGEDVSVVAIKCEAAELGKIVSVLGAKS